MALSRTQRVRSKKLQNQRQRRFRGLIERLEDRIVLADYVNAPLDELQMQALMDGADGMVELSRQVEISGSHGEPLRGIRKGGSTTRLGDVTPYGDQTRDGVANPIRDYYATTQPVDRSTDSLIVHLSNVDGVSVVGGLDNDTDEIRYEFHLQGLYPALGVRLDFGTPGNEYGIGIRDGGELSLDVTIDIRFTIGIRLDESLSAEQRIFVENINFDVSLLASTTADPMTIGIGILEATVPSVSLDARLDLHSGTLDPVERIDLEEIRSGTVFGQLTEEFHYNNLDASFEVAATLGRWRLEGSPVLQMIGDVIGIEPAITWNADLSEAFLFNRITPSEMAEGMERWGAWLSSWTDTSAYSVSIPFTRSATMGSVYDAGDGLNSYTSSLRDETGSPTFDSAQYFPGSEVQDVDYDPVSDRITYTMVHALDSSRSSSRANRIDTDQILGLFNEHQARIDADGTLRYEVSFDLTEESSPIDGRVYFGDIELVTTVTPNASGFSGSAAFSGLGLEYANATWTGNYQANSRIGDPDPLVDTLSLNELNLRLTDPTSLLREPVLFSGTSQLVLSGLTAIDNLIELPPSATLTATANSLESGLVELSYPSVPELAQFENVTFSSMIESLKQAILGTSDWDIAGDESLALLGQSMENFGAIRQQEIVDAITDTVASYESAYQVGRVILQDLPGFIEHLVVATASGTLQFTSNLAYHLSQGTLNWLVDATTSATQQVSIGLGFEPLWDYVQADTLQSELVEETEDFVGARGEVEAETSSTLTIGLQMDVSNPLAPTAFVDSQTRLDTNIYVNATPGLGTPVSLDGATGALGVQLTDGSVIVAANLNTPSPASPARFSARLPNALTRARVSNLPNIPPNTVNLGRMRADFGVIPDTTQSLESSRLQFEVQNVGNPANATTLTSSPSFPDLRAAIDLPNFLQSVPVALNDLFEGLEEQLRDDVFGVNLPLIGEGLDGPANFIRNLRTRMNTEFSTLTGFGIDDIELKLNRAIRQLLGRVGDYVDVDASIPTDIRFTLSFVDAPIDELVTVNTDLGVPALGASLDATMSVQGSYDFTIAFVVSVTEGVYLDTTTETIGVFLDANLEGTASGRLGFLSVNAVAGPSDPDCGAFHAAFTVGLTDPNQDGRLKLNELGDGSIIDDEATGLEGCAGIRLDIEATATEWMPSIVTDLSIDWTFDGSDMRGNVPEVTFGGIGVKLGPLLSKVLLPLFDKLEKIFDPIDPILRLLDTSLPIIDQFRDPVTLLSIAEDISDLLSSSNSDFARSIESIRELIAFLVSLNNLVNTVTAEQGTQGVIDIGSIQFGGIGSPQFDARLPVLDSSVMSQATTRSDWDDQMGANGGAPNTSRELSSSPGTVHLPFLENPLGTIEWLLGFGEAELIAWELPSVFLSLPFDLSFTPIPGLVVAFYGGIQASFNLTVGIDTYGVSRYRQTGQISDVLAGFYISDTDQPDGSGRDIPEIPITGKIIAGIGVGSDNAGTGVSATVGGGIYADVDLDLIDHDGDGKIRGHELQSPNGCFVVRGGFGVTLEVRFGAGPARYTYPFARQELANFNAVLPCPDFLGDAPPPATLAKLNEATGELTLLMGDRGTERDVYPNEVDEVYLVTRVDGKIRVAAFGYEQVFTAGDVTSIYADAGSGDDFITVDSSVFKTVHLIGGIGDDVLVGGSGPDTLEGGDGDDFLRGGLGSDTIHGDEGDDQIAGEEGADFLFGDDGDDILQGGSEDDELTPGPGSNISYGEDGHDTVFDGPEKDVAYGGPGNDTIQGLSGSNTFMGESGFDTIIGGFDVDLIDGGSDFNTLSGMAGDDLIYGGDDGNDIDGGQGEDYVEGGNGEDVIEGGLGNDILYGGGSKDTIRGGNGEDLIYGQSGPDDLRGGDGIDIIEGGSESDLIDGGRGNDQLYGNAHGDEIYGGPGDDEIFGEDGPDHLFGGSQDLDDPNAPGFTDDDTIYGGESSDTLVGGYGVDTLYGQSGSDTLVGNDGDDWLEGGDLNDTIYGDNAPLYVIGTLGGSDTIFGGSENDTLFGGPLTDRIRGNAGDDSIFGQDGDDWLYGDDGADYMHGGADSDTIDGGTGGDHILGATEIDYLYGNDGLDTIEGNEGDDFVYGNDQADLLFGDEGNDTMRGGTGNDTIRGGTEDDTISGDEGDDLLLGNDDRDTIYGDLGNDVIYGGNGNDTAYGGLDDDRIYGELGADTLLGNEGNDVVEGGAGDDDIFGEDGDDALYGDRGDDEIHGGNGNDFISAGDGVVNILYGDDGNDTLVGSEEGTNDANFKDTLYFGDLIYGGNGNDKIDSLGGADVVDGGLGNDRIHGGNHGDQILGGPAAVVPPEQDNDEIYGGDGDDNIMAGAGNDFGGGGAGINTIDGGTGTNTISATGNQPTPAFNMGVGPERRGLWSELSGSASDSGLTQVGGFEEAVFATDFGVYVAWVDWRNGNSEIYVAYHDKAIGEWMQLAGFAGNGSASGGGISNDVYQSRRPTLFKTENSDSLIVAWTSIDETGFSTIEVAREDEGWARKVNPAQTGTADHASFVPFSDDSGILAWRDTISGVERTGFTQYWYEPIQPVAYQGFLAARQVTANINGSPAIPSNVDVTDYDVAATDYRVAFVLEYGDSQDHNLHVFSNRNYTLLDESVLAPGSPPSVNFEVYTPGTLGVVHSESDFDTDQPTIGIQWIQRRVQGQNEIELETDIVVAWHSSSDRQDQVDGVKINIPLEGSIGAPQPLIPQYLSDDQPRTNAETISETIGYAAKPELAVSYWGTFLVWQDDGVFLGDGRSSLYILSRYRDTAPGDYILSEFEPQDASGRGLSQTGRSLQAISIGLPVDGFSSTEPYIVWTEANTATKSINDSPMQAVYLRVTADGLTAVDDYSAAGRLRRQRMDVLSNDLNLFGEGPGELVSFDGREFGDFDVIQFTSPKGAKVMAHRSGLVTYNPPPLSKRESRGQLDTYSETFVYRVTNFIHEAEALATFIVLGADRWEIGMNPKDGGLMQQLEGQAKFIGERLLGDWDLDERNRRKRF